MWGCPGRLSYLHRRRFKGTQRLPLLPRGHPGQKQRQSRRFQRHCLLPPRPKPFSLTQHALWEPGSGSTAKPGRPFLPPVSNPNLDSGPEISRQGCGAQNRSPSALGQGATNYSTTSSPGYYSHLFVIPKPGGRWRPLIEKREKMKKIERKTKFSAG